MQALRNRTSLVSAGSISSTSHADTFATRASSLKATGASLAQLNGMKALTLRAAWSACEVVGRGGGETEKGGGGD